MSLRREEILAAVDDLLATHDEWENDPLAPSVPSVAFESAINGAITICAHGDIPGDCRQLIRAMEDLSVQWIAYEDGSMEPTGLPKRSFWNAMAEVVRHRQESKHDERPKLESVKILKGQNVTDAQIATIYSANVMTNRGPKRVGPFHDSRGVVLSHLIRQEAEQPGSVIPPDWIHPDRQAEMDKVTEANRNRLTRVQGRATDNTPKEDPLKLLKDGQYADVVAKVCKMPLADVIALAHEHGIEVSSRPNLMSERSDYLPKLSESQERVFDAQASRSEDVEFVAEPDTTDDDGPETFDAAESIRAILDDTGGSADASEIAGLIKERHGETLTTRQVAAFVRHMKRGAAVEANS
mgnify:FL=1